MDDLQKLVHRSHWRGLRECTSTVPIPEQDPAKVSTSVLQIARCGVDPPAAGIAHMPMQPRGRVRPVLTSGLREERSYA